MPNRIHRLDRAEALPPVTVTLTGAEWRVIHKALALFVGLKVVVKPEERERAVALRKQWKGRRLTSP